MNWINNIQAVICVIDLLTTYFFYEEINQVFCFNKFGSKSKITEEYLESAPLECV